MPAPTVTDDGSAAIKTRDADNTRSLLLQAARRRFALDGYSATTVRDIASDAGVNVALINRYFASKEGLFEACLARTVEELGRTTPGADTVDAVVREIVSQVTESPGQLHPPQLLLLLRSSGDAGADRIRRATFRYFSERLAAAAGWVPNDPSTEHLMLRAQVAMSTAFGIVLLRATSGLEPLASASGDELTGPVGDVIRTLLAP